MSYAVNVVEKRGADWDGWTAQLRFEQLVDTAVVHDSMPP